MTFSRKIFLSVFLVTLILGSLIIWASHRYTTQQTEEKFISQYSKLNSVLATNLNSLDVSTEALMQNAAKVIAAKDAEKGLLSNQTLKDLRDELSVSHIFIINKNGKFIRSTNEDADLIPNLYSFCADYQKLVKGTSLVEATPVVKPDPEPNPHKFLSIPTRDKSRIIEVGVRVDFIGKTLSDAMKSDSNLVAMSLFDPKGTPFGRFSAKGIEFRNQKVTLPTNLQEIQETKDSFRFYSKVDASHKVCCQCNVAGTSNNGEYYYVLETEVSKGELKAIQARTNQTFIMFAIAILLMALTLSKIISGRLVRNIKRATDKVRRIGKTGSVGDRINSHAQDEVAYLTEEFDQLLDKLEDSQQRLVEKEKIEAKVQMAKEIAHNIKSPITAIEMMLPMMIKMPDEMKGVLRNSVKEIKTLSQRLKAQADSMSFESNEPEMMYLPAILREQIALKQIEYSSRTDIKIELIDETHCSDAFVKGNSSELISILSNLVNNAIESYSHGGTVTVRLHCDAIRCTIFVIDDGVGIPSEYLPSMGSKSITFKGNKGHGLGLTHAFKIVQSWGGKISIDSEVGVGTTVTINLSKSLAAETSRTDNFQANAL